MLDFISGPIWKDIYDTKKKELVTGINVVDNDEFVYFDKDQEKKDKHKMLYLLGKLMKRLDEVNDGSFEVDDRETERVKSL